MNPRENIPYNKAVFMSTHNSYAPKIKASIESQLDQEIRGLELDIHNPHIEHLQHFSIGHIRADGDVYHKEGNPKTDLFDDWLQIIKQWSDNHANHEPITLFVDIKSELVESSPPNKELILLNTTIANVLTRDKLYVPADLTQFNNNQRLGVKWPSLGELRNKIIVVLTGDRQSKWHYWKTLAQEANCFVSYTHPDDSEEDYSNDMLQEVKFVNAEPHEWKWTNHQLKDGKIVRLYSYNPDKSTFRRRITYPLDRWPEVPCNLPATDYPFKYSWRNFTWYQKTVETLQSRLLENSK